MAITGETRIVDLPEKVSLVPGDFFVVDNENGATSKIPAAAVSGSATAGLVAEEYSNASTYAVGEYCIHVESGIPKLYKCTTAITTAEAWNSAHWTQTDAGSELTTANADIATLNSNLTDLNFGTEVPITTLFTADGTYTAPAMGYVYGYIRKSANSTAGLIRITSNKMANSYKYNQNLFTANEYVAVMLPVVRGEILTTSSIIEIAGSSSSLTFCPLVTRS